MTELAKWRGVSKCFGFSRNSIDFDRECPSPVEIKTSRKKPHCWMEGGKSHLLTRHEYLHIRLKDPANSRSRCIEYSLQQVSSPLLSVVQGKQFNLHRDFQSLFQPACWTYPSNNSLVISSSPSRLKLVRDDVWISWRYSTISTNGMRRVKSINMTYQNETRKLRLAGFQGSNPVAGWQLEISLNMVVN